MENNSQNVFFSHNLKFMRERCGLTQKELANYIGTSRDNITKYEDGTVPKLPALLNIVKFFHISFEKMCEEKADETWIFSRSENENPLIKPTNDPTNISKPEKSLVGFEQTQANEPQSQYQSMSLINAEINSLKKEVTTLKERLQEKEEHIRDLKEHIQTLKSAKFPSQLPLLEGSTSSL